MSELTAWFQRLPVVVRIGLFFGVWLTLWLPIAIPLSLLLQWRPPTPPTISQKLPLVSSLYLLAFPILWGFARLQAIPFSSYGLSWQFSVLQSLSIGLGVGIVGLVGLFAWQYQLGWVEWQKHHQQSLSAVGLPALGVGVSLSLIEELVFRGFLPNQFHLNQPWWLAAILSSLIFALLHLVWEGRPGLPQLPGLWLMGLVLMLARWVNGGSLGLAWGLHAGWIWALASLDTIGLNRPSGRVPEWITGRAGQPLAGLLGILFLLTMGLLLWVSKDLTILH